MKIDNNYKFNRFSSANFTALRLKNNKKWAPAVLEEMKNNKKFQKLVNIYDKHGMDVVAEYMPYKGQHSDIIILKDSENNILSLTSSNMFKYDLFSSSFAIRDFKPGRTTKQNTKQDDISFFKKLFANIKKCLGI